MNIIKLIIYCKSQKFKVYNNITGLLSLTIFIIAKYLSKNYSNCQISINYPISYNCNLQVK